MEEEFAEDEISQLKPKEVNNQWRKKNKLKGTELVVIDVILWLHVPQSQVLGIKLKYLVAFFPS